jgi:type III secretion protein C
LNTSVHTQRSPRRAQAGGHRRAAIAWAASAAIVSSMAHAQDRSPDAAHASSTGAVAPAMASHPAASASKGASRIARATAHQGTRAFPGNSFVYRAEGKRLVDVLQDFAASQGVPAVVADGIDGVVNANFDTKPRLFLDGIARAYNMLWYYDGTAFYFYPGRAIQSKMVRLKGYRRDRLMSLMKSLDLDDQRYPIKFDERQQTLFISGPPRHVELVTSALESLDADVAEGAGRTVRVFALRFGSAADRAMGDTTVPGVASMLRKLYTHSGDANSANTDAVNDLKDGVKGSSAPSRLAGMMPKAAMPQSVLAPPRKIADSPKGPQHAPGAPSDPDDVPPTFEADEGTNSVVIHGRADRMGEYRTLIQRLDQKPLLVELEATIIEVNSDSVDALGVNWSIRGSRGSFSVTSPQSGVLTDTGSYSLGTVISNAGRELLARVNTLQGEGKARILSKPSVMGVANRPAVMREKRVATVRVAGNLEANLFQIEAGTLLEMTPQVTGASSGVNNIKLSLYIEDGAFETVVVDQIPVVKKTQIRTEAYVREGESLLIGGITSETDISQNNGVPGLSRVPVLGALFRSREHQTHRVERLFLITPRVLDSTASARRRPEAPAEVPSPAPAASSATAIQAPATAMTGPASARLATQSDQVPREWN